MGGTLHKSKLRQHHTCARCNCTTWCHDRRLQNDDRADGIAGDTSSMCVRSLISSTKPSISLSLTREGPVWISVLATRQFLRHMGRQREGRLADDAIYTEPNKRVDTILIIDLRHQHRCQIAQQSCLQSLLLVYVSTAMMTTGRWRTVQVTTDTLAAWAVATNFAASVGASRNNNADGITVW